MSPVDATVVAPQRTAPRPAPVAPTIDEVLEQARDRIAVATLDADVRALRREQVRMALAHVHETLNSKSPTRAYAEVSDLARARMVEAVGQQAHARTNGHRV
ncbi:hypothetical protein [Microbacterium sp. Bi128]|uniref:hypothetical protein n=1 Tax=Microbacterium sp. Bi128 TaxID=2821115 RepID=UPI001D991794|nr:hypothetical protein [Microbacterium sp. Bi128]CAH0254045.1 hypothetical protein SRABI128_02982 [Microbacterium sp. Bi128]